VRGAHRQSSGSYWLWFAQLSTDKRKSALGMLTAAKIVGRAGRSAGTLVCSGAVTAIGYLAHDNLAGRIESID
jgi:hypothetical protein